MVLCAGNKIDHSQSNETMPAIAKKVLLIGWDAADWKVAGQLMDAGRMPNLARFVSEGVMGNLATLYPVLSPMLWTSIATGKRAHKHGIHGFSEPDPDGAGARPVTNLGRSCKAIWNILNQHGLRSQVVGWWPSHPAEPINGVMVSNRFQEAHRSKDGRWPLLPGTVHPASLAAHVERCRVHPTELEPEQLLPFVPGAAQIDQTKDRRLFNVAKILAETASIQAVSTALLQLEAWDFHAVYFDAIDHACHAFMRYRAPRLDWVAESDHALYKDVVDTTYQFHDLMLGATLQFAGEDTVVIIVSDHGFHPDHLRPREVPNEPAGPADEHRQYGVIAIRGPGIRRDQLLFGASLLDVTPTILSIFGLPVGRDMDGKVLAGAFEKAPALSFVDSWEQVPGDAGRHPPGVFVDPLGAQEALQQLAELGYIDAPGEDKQRLMQRTTTELRFNLARDYFGARHYGPAIAHFAALWEEHPDESRFGVKLIDSYLATGQASEARAALRLLLQRKKSAVHEARGKLPELARRVRDAPADQPDARRELRIMRKRVRTNVASLVYLHARLLQLERKHKSALRQFERALRAQPHLRPSLALAQVESLFALRRWKLAEARLLEALAIEPVNGPVRLGLARTYLGLRRYRDALVHALAAVGLNYHNPRAHYVCGQAHERCGRRGLALKAYQTAVAQNPLFPDAQAALARLNQALGRSRKAAEHHQLAAAARAQLRALRAGRLGAPVTDTDDLQRVASLASTHPAERLEAIADEIVIVSGLPRSGTSMLMQVVTAGGLAALTDQRREADADNPRGYYEFEAVKGIGADTSWVPRARGKAVKVVAPLLPYLPQVERYRVIFVERPLQEILDSQTAMLQRLGKPSDKRSRRRLAQSYVEQIARVQKLVRAKAGMFRVLAIDYHAALAQPHATAKEINDFLGGDLDEAKMAAAIDPALRRQYGSAA
jgi:predicted AlkP superfamily phosphohydrolase/phosphomutase/tetratricopeptide (TPR) repeat protein